ncbi:substrate-binding domain-containing protein [Rudanella paleaurantiibacter]|uniref:Substrate-binding domain-containing protein n=1 Tax=Rudanella paleaurantiibacter TaxID=2614655 RepID=A0A7J5TZT7_9BACT|nr:LacI family DNA-binding transcriptional regulator [Rudanella paleaurantiibacter]KAB7730960.1 substrate-binding domain-containing protein [Rudanella paleaurantiibacter]
MEAVTIKDIARALNLSTSTVSRALRGSYEINPETKRLVMEYAERMNYRPNPIALSLKENRSRVIGVIVPQIANDFFSQAINGIEAIAYNRGYHVIIAQSHESFEREVVTVQQSVARKVDGLLISLSSETNDVSHLQELRQKNFPIVLFDRVSDELDTVKIVSDNYGGAFAATEHLIRSGRRRIAHVTIPPYMSITQERLAGYRAALEQNGLPYDESLIRYVGFGQHEIDPIVDDLLEQSPPPDAFFAASDRLALGCLATLQARRIVIPEQVSIVGFTNIGVAHLLSPPMSTVVQPAKEIGQTAAERLIELIERKQKAAPIGTVRIPTQLIARQSSGV